MADNPQSVVGEQGDTKVFETVTDRAMDLELKQRVATGQVPKVENPIVAKARQTGPLLDSMLDSQTPEDYDKALSELKKVFPDADDEDINNMVDNRNKWREANKSGKEPFSVDVPTNK